MTWNGWVSSHNQAQSHFKSYLSGPSVKRFDICREWQEDQAQLLQEVGAQLRYSSWKTNVLGDILLE